MLNSMNSTFSVFPNDPTPETIEYAEGVYLYTKHGNKYLDTTAGSTSYAVLGWNHPDINNSIIKQLSIFTY